MENIKFVKEIMGNYDGEYYEIGNCRYYPFVNGNIAKLYVKESGIICEIVNKTAGKIDECYFPFINYFKPVRCSAGAPLWYQHIDRGAWYFSPMYKHVLPTQDDFKAIKNAVYNYFKMFN